MSLETSIENTEENNEILQRSEALNGPAYSPDRQVTIQSYVIAYAFKSQRGEIWGTRSRNDRFVDDLLEVNAVTKEQKESYARGEKISIPSDEFSAGVYRLSLPPEDRAHAHDYGSDSEEMQFPNLDYYELYLAYGFDRIIVNDLLGIKKSF